MILLQDRDQYKQVGTTSSLSLLYECFMLKDDMVASLSFKTILSKAKIIIISRKNVEKLYVM